MNIYDHVCMMMMMMMERENLFACGSTEIVYVRSFYVRRNENDGSRGICSPRSMQPPRVVTYLS